LPGGETQKRSLRGLIAVARPDKLRLRALGPGGINLFDVRVIAGKIEVLYALKDPQSSVLGQILQSMVGDLCAAYDLEPRPAERKITVGESELTVEEPGRTVILSDFKKRGAASVPAHLKIRNTANSYEVDVSAQQSAVDEKLDPTLFSHNPASL